VADLELSIIVVSWNGKADVLRCLAAIKSAPDRPAVVVVDNASEDGTVEAVSVRYPDVAVLKNAANLGYTGGNNVGIKYAMERGADAVLLLNDDAVLAYDTVAQLAQAASRCPEAGMLGPSIYALEDPSCFMSAGGTFTDSWHAEHRGLGKDVSRYGGVTEVDFLSGCALFVTRSTIERIGLLDDRFFAYYEDVDWCYRAGQAGVKLLVVPQARVWHPDTRVRDAESSHVAYYMARNRLLFLSKHHLGLSLLARELVVDFLRIINWSVNPKWRHKRPQRNALIWAVLDYTRGCFGRLGRSF